MARSVPYSIERNKVSRKHSSWRRHVSNAAQQQLLRRHRAQQHREHHRYLILAPRCAYLRICVALGARRGIVSAA